MTLSQKLQHISDGDEEAFRQLVTQFSDRLFQFALQIVKNREDAEEVISDVFLKVWLLRARLPHADRLIFYLYKAVKNTGLNYLKKSNRKRILEEDLYYVRTSAQVTHTPENHIISEENVACIREAINQLPPRCRQIFILIKVDRLSYKQTAELLDISEATINVQMSIAFKKLNASLTSVLPEIFS